MPRLGFRRIHAILALVLVAVVLAAAAGTVGIGDGGGDGVYWDGPYSQVHFGW